MKPVPRREWKFDYLKGISAIIIVFFHCPIYGIIGDIVIYAFRFPVPVFFMISGYYSVSKDSVWIRRKALYLVKLIFFSELLYCVWFFVQKVLLYGQAPGTALSSVSAFHHPIRTLLCGCFFNQTLWYLYAAAWTYGVFLLFRKIHFSETSKTYLFLALFLAFSQAFGRYYVQNNYDIDACIFWFRNVLLFGMPLTMLGAVFAAHEQCIREKLSPFLALCMIFVGHCIIVAEYFIYGKYMDFHLSTLVISTGIFAFALIFPGGHFLFSRPLSYVGRELSTFLYLTHPLIYSILTITGAWLSLEESVPFLIAKPFLTLGISLLLSQIIRSLLSLKKPQISLRSSV